MKDISTKANLSQQYTYYCLRATAMMILSNAGVQARNIMSVTGHRNEQSLKSYVREPSLRQRDEMCKILHSYGRVEETITGNEVATRMIESASGESNTMITNRKDTLEINSRSAVFAGANFNGQTTINLQINQQ